MTVIARARRDAHALLDAVWRQANGSMDYPIDPVQIATRLGLQVRVAPMQANASGALVLNRVSDDEVEKTIFVNDSHAPVRQRFTCAHELGHYYDKVIQGKPLEGTVVDWRDARSSQGTDPREVYANNFAAALLMPDVLLQQLGAAQRPIEAAYALDVSVESMEHRLKGARLPA